MKRRVGFFFFLAFLPFIFGCTHPAKQGENTPSFLPYQTVVVKSGKIDFHDTYISTIQPAVQTTLAFKVGGRITRIFVDKGNFVRKGDVIATVDGEEFRVNIASIQSTLASLEALKQSTALMLDAQISSMEQKVQQAKIAFDLAKIGSGTSAADIQQQTAEIAYQTALTEQETTEQVLKQQEQSLYGNAKQALAQAKIFLEPLGNFLDELMGISDTKRQRNDFYEAYFSAKNFSLKAKIEDEWYALNALYKKLQPKLIFYSTEFDSANLTKEKKDEMLTVLNEVESFLVRVRNILKLTYDALDASVASSAFPQSAIDDLKKTIVTFQTNLESIIISPQGNYLVGVKGIKDSIQNFEKQAQMQRSLLAKKVAIALKQKDLSLTQLDAGSTVAEKQYKEALAGLEALKKQKDAQIDQINAQIAQAEGSLKQAQTMLSNTTLLAPFDGIVIEKMVDVGQVVAPGMPIVMVASPSKGKVVINVPEKRIGFFPKGKTVQIQNESLDISFTGVVTTLAPMADVISKRIPVEITFPLPKNLQFGMEVKVKASYATLTGLLIPEAFIMYEMGQSFVYVVGSGNTFQKVFLESKGCHDGMCVSNLVGFSELQEVVIAKP